MSTLENTKNQFQTRIGTVLVTGATGFIGHNLVRQLVKQGHRVFALVRQTSNVNFLKDLGVSLIYGDITDNESLNKVLERKIDIIFHCAALVDNGDKNKLYKINVEGTRNVCNLALRLKVERMVYVSSVAVVSGNLEVPLTQELPYAATNPYGESKIEAEKAVIEFRKDGLAVAIIRPPMVYGEEEPHLLRQILSLLRFRLLPLINGGSAKLHLGYVGNVVNALLLAAGKKEFLEGTFFIADEDVFTLKEVFSIFAQSLNYPKPVSLPKWFTPVLTCIPCLGKKFEFLCRDRVYDISRIKSLGYKEEFKARESLIRTALSLCGGL